MWFLPLRVYLIIAAVLLSISLVIGVYSKGWRDSKSIIETHALKEERRVVETATTARRHADVHNSVGDGLRVNDGYRRD